MADAISATSSAFATDNDPEFVRLAAPSNLKMVEMMLEAQPRHHGLLSTACSGFTQYAYAFLQVDADGMEPSRAAEAQELRARAGRMYDRARDYCLRALDINVGGLRAELPTGKTQALSRTEETSRRCSGSARHGEGRLRSQTLPRCESARSRSCERCSHVRWSWIRAGNSERSMRR